MDVDAVPDPVRRKNDAGRPVRGKADLRHVRGGEEVTTGDVEVTARSSVRHSPGPDSKGSEALPRVWSRAATAARVDRGHEATEGLDSLLLPLRVVDAVVALFFVFSFFLVSSRREG